MKALVTGGGGFLGGAVARALLERGDSVRILSRGDYPVLRDLGVETLQGDVSDPHAVSRAVSGMDVVFHVAAKTGIWGPREEYETANVIGTRQVVNACKVKGVGRLVYTSSPSVVFNGQDMEGVDESVPYATHFEADYPATKAEAEQIALGANGPSLAVTALRPHLIWGPGDTSLVPRILARANRLFKVGSVPKPVDSTYIDNAVAAHLQAADRLSPDSPLASRPYFISQGEPMPVWDLVNRILEAAGSPPITRTVPFWVAYAGAAAIEEVYRTFKIDREPPMTRFVVRELATSHWFDLTAARRDLGYSPAVSIEEGLQRLGAWLRSQPPMR
jgi:nucleoside-diphosphate-sugar epimerase